MKQYIDKIDKDGYCVIPQVFSQEQVAKGLALAESLYARTVDGLSERMPFLNKDQPMIYNLQSKDPFFTEILFSSQLVEDILIHFLNDSWFKSVPSKDPNYILRSYLARSSNYRMPMHIDSFIPYGGPHVYIMQYAMILEDQNEENGCTVLVPGSHLSQEYTTQESFEDAVPIPAKAGDCVMWDSRTWHGTTENVSGKTRWSLIATMQRWWIKQAFNIPGNLPQDIYDTLSPKQKAIMGFCSVPYDHETVGIDMKRNYDLLPARVEDYRN